MIRIEAAGIGEGAVAARLQDERAAETAGRKHEHVADDRIGPARDESAAHAPTVVDRQALDTADHGGDVAFAQALRLPDVAPLYGVEQRAPQQAPRDSFVFEFGAQLCGDLADEINGRARERLMGGGIPFV